MNAKRAPRLATVLALLLTLSACGGDEEGTTGATGDALAEEEMGVPLDEIEEMEATAELDCPPDVPPGAGPDVIGVHAGMRGDDALTIVRCALGEAAVVKAETRWLDRIDTYGVTLGTQFFTVSKGDHRECDYAREWQDCEGGKKWGHVDEVVSVATPGAPGQETAYAVWRSQNFRAGKMPAAQAVLDALVAKYGPPQITENYDDRNSLSSGTRRMRWMADPQGRPLTESNPLYNQCLGGVFAEAGNTQASWRQGCGRNISALVVLAGDNPGLAMSLHTAMIDQDGLFRHVDAMNQALSEAGQSRRDAEVQAGGEADDVRL